MKVEKYIMVKVLKIKSNKKWRFIHRGVIITLFLLIYLHLHYAGFVLGMGSEFCENCHIYYVFLILLIWMSFIVLKQTVSSFIVVKIILFTTFILVYFYIEQLLITLTMYSIGGSGGWIRHHVYEQIDYVFKWYEVLFWNFIFSLHYPVYIFIFFKPFVNHLDKSIKKIQKKIHQNTPL